MSYRYLPFIGRILIGLPFAMSGLSKLAAYGPTTANDRRRGTSAPAARVRGSCRRRARRGASPDSRLSRAPRRARAGRLLNSNRLVVFMPIRRPEPD